MRLWTPLFIISFLVISCGINVKALESSAGTFTANLFLGAEDAQVAVLQRVLNRDQDTRVANTGPGSPGNETSYFGSLTKAAVVRFQEKYADEVLAPAGLARGSGYVGFYTRVKLNILSAPTSSVGSPVPVVLSPATPSPVTIPNSLASTTATATSQNPNLKNIDKFFDALDKVGYKQGLSSTTIAILKEEAIRRVSTTTDLRAAFLEIVQGKSHQSVQDGSFMDTVLTFVGQALGNIFRPERAQAAVGAPFGGALLYAFPCNGGVWNLTIEPLPPFFPILLSYVSGSQAFLSYNTPLTSWLLGEYEPVPMAYCWIGEVPYPSEGMITPMIGSSPI